MTSNAAELEPVPHLFETCGSDSTPRDLVLPLTTEATVPLCEQTNFPRLHLTSSRCAETDAFSFSGVTEAVYGAPIIEVARQTEGAPHECKIADINQIFDSI